MKETLFIILSFILGILIYEIFKINNKYIEGAPGQTYYDKCCPKGYKFSPKIKKCVLICDGCGLSSYNKMKLEWETTGAYGMKSGAELVDYYDCDDHDASKIYDFDKLNNIFNHSEIKDQYDYYKDDSDPSPAEEKGNETWKNIRTNFGNSTADFEGERSSINFPFKAISTNLYYTGENDCDNDYESTDKSKPEGLNNDCRGYWKLDTTDSRFEYIKDNPDNYYPPPFMITKDPPEGIESATYITNNKEKLNDITENLNANSPVYDYYNTFATNYDTYRTGEIVNTMEENIRLFCDNSESFSIISELCEGTINDQKSRINASLCVDNDIDGDNKDDICNNIPSSDRMKMCEGDDELFDIKVECSFSTTTPVATTTPSE